MADDPLIDNTNTVVDPLDRGFSEFIVKRWRPMMAFV